jgi:hypothetical protein
MGRAGRPDATSLVAGILIAGLGGLVLLDELGAIDLSFAAFAPAVCAVLGAILLTRGLSRGA